jgi:small subunit ribosomal protein S6
MRHYEIILLIHPDQSEQVEAMVGKYKKIISDAKGLIHREENLGRRSLAYPIEKVRKAHFVLLNVFIDTATVNELRDQFRYNDAVLRHLIEVQEGDEKEILEELSKPSVLALNAEREVSEESTYQSARG